jgi:hypothetical protein
LDRLEKESNMTLEEAIIVINNVETQANEAGFGSIDGPLHQMWLDASVILRDEVRKNLLRGVKDL